MSQRELEAWLRTPRGVLALLGGSLAAAVVLALALGSQRQFFESRVRETYAAPTAEAEALARALVAEGGASQRGTTLSPRQVEDVYQAWMQVGERWPAEVPSALVRADGAFLARAERTMIAGSVDQRRAAARFLAASQDPRAVPILEAAGRRASRRGENALAQEIETGLRSLKWGSSRVWGPRASPGTEA